jgi:AAA domain
MADLTAEQRAELEAIAAADPGPEGGPNGAAPATSTAAPAQALGAARVDLVERIREGIPERRLVPGGEPWLLAGKRYLIPAPAGTGKSLLALVVAVGVVEAGGTVAILDVENGADEYARRLADVLDARGGSSGALAGACMERLAYYEWPALRVTWGPEEWAAAFAGVDLAIFDSSRLVLSAAGLAEDSNDDYSTFVSALLVPLARAGITTVVLDNTGHEERERARGASAKADLNEVVYLVKVGEEFDRDQAGHLRLVRRRTRFAELPGELHVPLGGGAYGPAKEVEPGTDSDGFRPTGLMERASQVIEASPGLNRKDVLSMVGGKRNYAAQGLALLIAEGYVRREAEGRERLHYSERPYREVDDAL